MCSPELGGQMKTSEYTGHNNIDVDKLDESGGIN